MILRASESRTYAAEHLRAAPLGREPELLLGTTQPARPAARWRSRAFWWVEASSTPPTVLSTRPSGAAATRRSCLRARIDLVAEEPEAIRLAQALALSAGAREGIAETHCAGSWPTSASIATAVGLPKGTA